MNDKKNIDRLFQEKFKDFEMAPDDAVWNRISESLPKKKKKRTKSHKARSKSKRTRRIKKSKVQAQRPKSKLKNTHSPLVKQPPKKPSNSKKAKKKVPELLKLSPNDPVDSARFKDSIEVEKLP